MRQGELQHWRGYVAQGGRWRRVLDTRQHTHPPTRPVRPPTWRYCRVPKVPPAGLGLQNPRPSSPVVVFALSWSAERGAWRGGDAQQEVRASQQRPRRCCRQGSWHDRDPKLNDLSPVCRPHSALTSGKGVQVRPSAQFWAGWSECATGHSMPSRPGAVRLSAAAALQPERGWHGVCEVKDAGP